MRIKQARAVYSRVIGVALWGLVSVGTAQAAPFDGSAPGGGPMANSARPPDVTPPPPTTAQQLSPVPAKWRNGTAGGAAVASYGPQGDMGMQSALPVGYPRPVSEWRAKEMAFYEKALVAGKFDVLVAPFQVSGWAFDRATRSLMTAELAAAIARSQKGVVADPYLVAKALGEGQRQYQPKDVIRLADLLGVRTVIRPFVGHDRSGKMHITVMVGERGDATRPEMAWTQPPAVREFGGIAFGDELPAIEAFETLLPELVKAVGHEPVPPAMASVDVRTVKLDLLATPKAMLAAPSSAVRDAYIFLLLDALTPDMQERAREQFAERALLALAHVPPSTPDYRALRARAYMTLGLRMAAIKVLGVPQNDDERELMAALNGNLPDVRKYAALEKNAWKWLLQKRDETRIASHYGVVNRKDILAEIAARHLPGELWPYMATRALLDWDNWMQFDNASTKALLDAELPIKGLSLQDIIGGGINMQDESKLRTAVDLSVVNHGRSWLEGNTLSWCCAKGADRPGLVNYLEWALAVGDSNLTQRIQFYSQTQGRSEVALQYANSLDVVYQGYPYYMAVRAQVEARLAGELGGAQREGMRKTAYDHAFNAQYWEQGQSRVSELARGVVQGTGLNPYGYHDALYYEDRPFRPYFSTWASGGDMKIIERNQVEAVKGAMWEFSTVSRLVQTYRSYHPGEPLADMLLESVEQRFLGDPRRNDWFAYEALSRGDVQAAQGFYRDNIRLAPGQWHAYEELGRMAFETGDVEEASKIYLSYPGFKKGTDAQRVGVANDAYEAGSRFYWSGHFDLAKPLYEVAAAQGTGAASEMSSALRLKLLAGDIDGAMAGSMERARRYNDSYAFRDFLGMLHAKGQSTRAWEGFGQLVRESKRPHVWESALVGHHVGKTTEAQVVRWAQQDQFKGLGANQNAAAVYLLRFACTDRTPTAALVQELHGLDNPTWQLDGYHDLVVRAPVGTGTGVIAGPTVGGHGAVLPIGVFDRVKKHQVRSDLAYFAQAYRALQLKDYAGAKAVFDEASKLYDFSDTSIYILPYYAMAAAKAGDLAGVEAMLKVREARRGFDGNLARAVLAAVAGNTDQALESLRLARYRRPHTEDRPLLTQYTLGEIAEWVAEQTGDGRIRQFALEWVQKAQQFEPWHAWAYAMEARLTQIPEQRQRAIAMTQYLDPLSQRLSTFGAAEISAAVKAYKGRNPFLAPMVNAKGSSAI